MNKLVRAEIDRLSNLYNIPKEELENLLKLNSSRVKSASKIERVLSLNEIKLAVYNYFQVNSTPELKKSKKFKMATDGLFLRLSETEAWNILYRKFVGVLPGEENEQGRNCINGVNIFKYFQAWRVFELDSKTATEEDIKRAYRRLSRTYHPDIPDTGDARVFERINQMYRSLLDSVK